MRKNSHKDATNIKCIFDGVEGGKRNLLETQVMQNPSFENKINNLPYMGIYIYRERIFFFKKKS